MVRSSNSRIAGTTQGRSQRSLRRADLSTARGFSLVEAGIAIGCIAILLTVVLSSRGFIDNAKMRATVQTAKTIQTAAFAWAERIRYGKGYLGLTLDGLCVDDLAGMKTLVMQCRLNAAGTCPSDCGLRTGWDTPFTFTAPGAYFTLDFCTPTAALAEDATSLLKNLGSAVQAGGVGCLCPTCGVQLVIR
jgi:type II secretory pathway pseudopilin PulG